MGLEDRIENLESSWNSRDVQISVVYVETIETVEGRKELPLPAEYDAVDWSTIEPQTSGSRIAVRYPRRSGKPWRCERKK